MGANAVNTAVERLAPPVEKITGGRVHLRILSNLADRRLARADCTHPGWTTLAFDEYSGEDVRDGIIDAWAFAAADPYRAATHNKGIMNGVDAVVIATGNDWRAVEAGAHAYAARGGRYTSLSTWGKDAAGQPDRQRWKCPWRSGSSAGPPACIPAAQAAVKLHGRQQRPRTGRDHRLGGAGAKPGRPARAGHRGHPARAHEPARPPGRHRGRSAPATRWIAWRGNWCEEKQIRIDRAEEILKEWSKP